MAENKKNSAGDLSFPANMRYHREHAWARPEDNAVRVGISDYAQHQLGDVIFVELPQIGDRFAQGENFGMVESAKSVSTLYMPVSGEVIAVNEKLADSPEFVNQEPYGAGWMVLVKPDDKEKALDGLLTGDVYQSLLGANDYDV